MDIFVIVKQLVQLFLMLFLGYFLCKAGIFDRHTNQKMTKLCLYVTTPCLILTSVLQQEGTPDYHLVALTFAVAFNLSAFSYGPAVLNIGMNRSSKTSLKEVLSPGTALSLISIPLLVKLCLI